MARKLWIPGMANESKINIKIYLRNKEMQHTHRVIVNIQYDASF